MMKPTLDVPQGAILIYALPRFSVEVVFLRDEAPLGDRVTQGEQRSRQNDDDEDAEVESLLEAFDSVVGEEKSNAEENPEGGVEMQQQVENQGRRLQKLVVANLKLKALLGRRRDRTE